MGEINARGDDRGIVPTSSNVELIFTLNIDRSRAEPGEEIKTIEAQKGELEAAYNRRKQSLADSLAHLKSKVKALEPAKTTGRKKVGSTSN